MATDQIYCYETLPIDFFAGTMSRSQLMAALTPLPGWQEAVDSLQRFENLAAERFKQLGWEGDHQDDSSPAFFALPGNGDIFIGVIYKQGNNGACFVASPVPLPHLSIQED